jgi:hypothetical protein
MKNRNNNIGLTKSKIFDPLVSKYEKEKQKNYTFKLRRKKNSK